MREVPLGELVEIRGGGTPSRKVADYYNGPIPWATVKDLKGILISTTQETITNNGLSNSASNLIPAGNLIIATRMALGKAAINQIDIAINQDLKALLPDKKMVDTKYLLYFLLGKSAYFEGAGKGATVKGIKLDHVRSLSVPLPPLPEQKRLAAILEKADGVRRKIDAGRSENGQLIRSTFLEMFGDPLINDKKWKTESLSDVGTLERGKSRHRPRDAAFLLGGPYPLVQTGDVANSGGMITTFSETYSEAGLGQSRLWPKGTLCITIAANIGRTGILNFDACFPDSVVGFTPGPAVKVEFVREWFELIRQGLEERAPAVAQKNINLKILRALDIIHPPRSLQREFSDRVRAIRRLEEKQKHAAKNAETLFQSLLQRAFTGVL